MKPAAPPRSPIKLEYLHNLSIDNTLHLRCKVLFSFRNLVLVWLRCSKNSCVFFIINKLCFTILNIHSYVVISKVSFQLIIYAVVKNKLLLFLKHPLFVVVLYLHEITLIFVKHVKTFPKNQNQAYLKKHL